MPFDHDRLDVYRLGIEFVLDDASQSIINNIPARTHRLYALADDRGLSASEYEDEDEYEHEHEHEHEALTEPG